MANLRMISKKLQTAILSTGHIVKINTNQFYSKEQNRMITMYSVTMTTSGGKNKKLIKTKSQVEIVKCLVNIWDEVKDGG